VFWVHASNVARFEQSLREIADHVQIPDRDNPHANIFKLVHDWLRDERRGKWVLILDNVDDADFLLAQQPSQGSQSSGSHGRNPQPLLTYLPQSQNGSILITTRTRGVALKLVEETDIIVVEPMDEGHALALLEKKLGKLWEQSDGQDVAVLAAALEFMPLAIVQAAAYIFQRAPRCSVRQYIEQFQRNDKGKTTLLNHEGGHLRRDREAKNSIITWQISFDHIRQTRPSAADLLSLMSFFDRQGIPEALLRNRPATESRSENLDGPDGDPDDEDSAPESGCNDEFEEDVLTLRNYSFISVNVDATTFEMHGLVQLSMRKWLEAHGQLERWKHQYVKNLCAEFPTGEHENWVRCQALFPHAKSAVSQQPKQGSSLREWASILHHAAWYAWRRGNVVDAEKMSTKAMKVRTKMFGQDHTGTLSSMGMVGLAYKLGGRWQEAEELEAQVMETKKRVLGAEHPETLTSMANLASTFWNQGRWQEAKELEVQVIETSLRVLRAEHPDTLISMGNLASTYGNQGRWQEAEELEVQVMETMKKVLGAEHPSTLTSIGNLASTYRNQGRLQEAEELEVQVIETSLRVLGAEHPDTLTSMANLASTYRNQGRWQEAEKLEIQAIETMKRVLRTEHPDTLTSMANLASTYWNQGRWQEAEELGMQVMETRKRVLGAEHPDTLTSMANLASTYRNQDRLQEAEELEMQVIETRKRVLGTEHPDTLISMGNLALTYGNQGRW
jgi:tetratricopeptide (TPR) repeat protein